MARSGEQEQPPPGGAWHRRGSAAAPAARPAREPSRWRRAVTPLPPPREEPGEPPGPGAAPPWPQARSQPDAQPEGQSPPGAKTRPGWATRPGRAGSSGPEPRRATLPWRSQSLLARPSLARFLRPAGGETGELSHPGPEPRTRAGQAGTAGPQDGPATGREGAEAGDDDGAGRPAPQATAAELRELAEISDLLDEVAGLVHDLGSLVVGLMTAAVGAGDRPVRTFTVPPELADLAAAHQDLRKEQRSLSLGFDPNAGGTDRAALRGSLAALTERATRAIATAAAVSFPAGRPAGPGQPGDLVGAAGPGGPAAAGLQPASGPDGDPATAGTASEPGPGTGGQLTPPGAGQGPARAGDQQAAGSGPAAQAQVSPREESAAPRRQETGVQTTSPTGMTPGDGRETARWNDAGPRDKRLAPVAVALDAPDIDVAARWATLVTPYVSTVKIGLELYLRYGPAVVATVRGGSGVQVFLDLKLHDIPNTVAGAAKAVAKLHPEILTVHAAGGADMIKAAVEAAPDTLVAGVTLLTSMGQADLAALGVGGSVSDAVRRMAALAVSAGARGLVCSPQEVTAVRAEVGPGIMLITPGIRAAGATSDDQARIATPEEALKAGADLLVIGRPITTSADPGAAAAAIAAALRRAAPAA